MDRMKATFAPSLAMKKCTIVILVTLVFFGPHLEALPDGAPAPNPDFENTSYRDLLKRYMNHREDVADFMRTADIEEDPEKGLLRVAPGRIPLQMAKDLVDNVNALRNELLRRQLKEDDSVETMKSYLEDLANRLHPDGPPASSVRTKIILRIEGVTPRSHGMLLQLSEAFMQERGYVMLPAKTEGPTTRILGRMAGDRHDSGIKLVQTPTNTALDRLGSEDADIAILSRAGTTHDNNRMNGSADLTLPNFVTTIAYDAVVVVVNRDSPISTLTLPELRSYLTGRVPRVSLPKLQVFASKPGATTREVLKEQLFTPNENLTPAAKVCTTDQEILDNVANHSSSLGFVSLSAIKLGTGTKRVKLRAGDADSASEAIEATVITTKLQSYPLCGRISLAVTRNRSELAREFRRFVTSDTAKLIVQKCGFASPGISALDPGFKTSGIAYRRDLENRYRDSESPVARQYLRLIQNKEPIPFNIRFKVADAGVDLYSHLNPDARDAVDSLVYYLSQPGMENARVELLGFTDSQKFANDPEGLKNVQLSFERAKRVAQELQSMGIEVVPVSPEHGFGARMFVASNDSAAGQQANRRVELWLRVNP